MSTIRLGKSTRFLKRTEAVPKTIFIQYQAFWHFTKLTKFLIFKIKMIILRNLNMTQTYILQQHCQQNPSAV